MLPLSSMISARWELLPPTPAQAEALLSLLADASEEATRDVPRYVKYNAFRWLRDSGFDAVVFAVEQESLSEATREGLRTYATYERSYPQTGKAGLLPLATGTPDFDYFPKPRLMGPGLRIAAQSLTWVSLILGALLLGWSLRRSRAG